MSSQIAAASSAVGRRWCIIITSSQAADAARGGAQSTLEPTDGEPYREEQRQARPETHRGQGYVNDLQLTQALMADDIPEALCIVKRHAHLHTRTTRNTTRPPRLFGQSWHYIRHRQAAVAAALGSRRQRSLPGVFSKESNNGRAGSAVGQKIRTDDAGAAGAGGERRRAAAL